MPSRWPARQSVREHLGLSQATVTLAVDTLRNVLGGGKRLTRAECIAALSEAGIQTPSQVGYHLLWYASQKGVTCIAPHVGKEQTFVLLDDYVPDPLKRTMRARSCVIDAVPLESTLGERISTADRAAFENAFEPYGTFVEKPVSVDWK